MSDLLERTPVSVKSDLARAAEDLGAWAADETPVTPPSGKSEPYEALVAVAAGHSVWTLVHHHLITHTAEEVLGEVLEPRVSHRRALAQGSRSSVHPGTRALVDLRAWLNLPLDDLVRLVALSPSARAWWRRNPDAPIRPSKAGRLLRFHAAVGLLIERVGTDSARKLLHEGGWITETLDERRLVSLEATVQNLFTGPLEAPPALLAGLSQEALLAAVGDVSDELAQQRAETARISWSRGPDDSGEG